MFDGTDFFQTPASSSDFSISQSTETRELTRPVIRPKNQIRGSRDFPAVQPSMIKRFFRDVRASWGASMLGQQVARDAGTKGVLQGTVWPPQHVVVREFDTDRSRLSPGL